MTWQVFKLFLKKSIRRRESLMSTSENGETLRASFNYVCFTEDVQSWFRKRMDKSAPEAPVCVWLRWWYVRNEFFLLSQIISLQDLRQPGTTFRMRSTVRNGGKFPGKCCWVASELRAWSHNVSTTPLSHSCQDISYRTTSRRPCHLRNANCPEEMVRKETRKKANISHHPPPQ